MLQITLDKPGRFSTQDVAAPTNRDDMALVRVRRIGVCGTDLHAFAGRQPFFTYPRVLGHELGVEIVHVPDNDLGLRPGDRCAVEPSIRCGKCGACRRGKVQCCENLNVIGVHSDGGMRELFEVPTVNLHKSATLTLDQLALVETLCIGAHAVERAQPAQGEAALVIGAGPIGLTVMQFLQVAGADITVMDISDERLRFCREVLGIAKTVNPAKTDAPAEIRRLNGGDAATAVFDATGHPGSMMQTFDLAAHGGRIVFVGLVQANITFNDPNFHRRELTLYASRNSTPATFRRTIALIEQGRIDTAPWITHRLSLGEVPERFASLPGMPGLIKAVIDVA